MVILVETRIVSDRSSVTELRSATFEDPEDFYQSMMAAARGDRDDPFEVSIRSHGSDEPIIFSDVITNEDTNVTTNSIRNWTMSENNFSDILAPYGQRGGPYPFRYKRMSDRIRSQSDVRRNRVSVRETTQFLNNSDHIHKVKEWMVNPFNKHLISTLLDKDIGSHIRISARRVISSYEDVVGFYSRLNCILFNIVLYFGRSSLICEVNRVFGFVNTAGNGTRELPKKISATQHPGNPSSMVRTILRCIGKNDPSLPVTVEDIALMTEGLKIEFVFFSFDQLHRQVDSYGNSVQHSIMLKTRQIEMEEECLLTSSVTPILFYTYKRKVNGTVIQKRRFAQKSHSMVFKVTDLWKDNMHAEAVLDHHTVNAFIKNCIDDISPSIKYLDSTLVSDRTGYDNIIGIPHYIKWGIVNWSSLFSKRVSKKRSIASTSELISFINDMKTHLNTYKLAVIANESPRSLFDACKDLRDNLPTEIVIQIDLFSDRENKSLVMYEPFSTNGISSMYLLMCFLLCMTREQEDHEYHIPLLKFSSLSMTTQRKYLRHIAIKKHNGSSTPIEIRTVNNISTFSLVLDAAHFTDGVRPTFFSLFFRVGGLVETTLIEDVLKDNTIPFSKIVSEKTKVFVETHQKKLPLIGSSTAGEHLQNIINSALRYEGITDYFKCRGFVLNLIEHTKLKSSRLKGSYYLKGFYDVLPIQMETLVCLSSNLFEVVRPIGYDGTLYKEDMKELACVDLSKAYSSIMQGAYQSIWAKDIYGFSAQIGCISNWIPVLYDSDYAIVSYFADYGMSLINGSDINWTKLRSISPEFFKYTSSWWNQRYTSTRFVDNYVIINMCLSLSRQLGLRRISEKIDLFKEVQSALNIRYCLFDFNCGQRKAFHKVFRLYGDDDASYGYKKSLDKIQSDFGPLVASANNARFSISGASSPIEFMGNLATTTTPTDQADPKANRFFATVASALMSIYNSTDTFT